MRLIVRTRAPPRRTAQAPERGVPARSRSRQHAMATADPVTMMVVRSNRGGIAREPHIGLLALAARARRGDDGGHIALVGEDMAVCVRRKAIIHYVIKADCGAVGEGDVIGRERDWVRDAQGCEVVVLDTGDFCPFGVLVRIGHLLVFQFNLDLGLRVFVVLFFDLRLYVRIWVFFHGQKRFEAPFRTQGVYLIRGRIVE